MDTKKMSIITSAFDLIFVSFFIVVLFRINVVSSQLLNSPPITYITERNWRIYENEKVGQVIARIRAEDAEGDELQFGLEPRFFDQEAFSNRSYLPFTIDKDSGIVYLNESLHGRGGENILLYVTVNDGKLSAKTEVFVNILSNPDRNGSKNQRPPLIPKVQDILPSFESLPGVQSIRNNGQFNYQPPSTLFTVQPMHVNNFGNNNHAINSSTVSTTSQPYLLQSNKSINSINNIDFPINNNSLSANNSNTESSPNDIIWPASNSIKTTIILGILILGIFCIAAVSIVAIMYRKKIFKYKQNLSESSKAQLAKMSHQRIGLSNISDDRNSMVLQNWSGPQAYGNRYVPWERDQSIQHNDIPSVSAVENTVLNCETTIFSTQSKSLDSWEYPRHRLKFFNILGEGAFGQVWKCEATEIVDKEDVTTVAVKTLKENATEVEKKDLLSELEVMKSLEPHVNVVRLLACCTEKDPVFVILEYVNRGKLQTFLRQSRAERHYGNTHGESKCLTSADLTSFMYQVAKGMDFLTSKGIIHRDLAARNILINENNTCKVADFGFARDVVSSKIYERKSEGKLPIRWMAIESLYDNIFSVKSDIWSFGILMWEIVTLGSTPYPGISAGEVMRKVRDGFRLEKPEHCRRELYNIMYYCWSKDPNERPLFSEIVDMLDKLLHTEKDYIELERFPDHNYYNILSLSNEKV